MRNIRTKSFPASIIFFLSMQFVLLFIFYPSLSASRQDGVLLLNSYHFGYAWSDLETQAIDEVFSKPDLKTELFLEYMDEKRYAGYFEKHFDGYLTSKYSNVNFRVIIAIDDPAFKFCLKYRDKYFPGAPIIFCGVSDYPYEEIEKLQGVAGAYERVELKGTIDLAIKLQPEAKEVYIITDKSLNSRLSYMEAKSFESLYTGRIAFKYLDTDHGLTFHEYYDKIRSIPAGQIVIYRGFVSDIEKRSENPDRVIYLTCGLSKSPVYVTKTDELGTGAVGGVLRSGYEHGLYAANTARDIISGLPVEKFKKVTDPGSKPWIDYKAAKKMGLKLDKAPAGVKFLNKEESFLVKHFRVLAVSGALILLQMFIIALLFINVRKRERAERALLDTAAELSKTNEELKYFSYAASHDLKEPLRQIKINAQLMERNHRNNQADPDRETLSYIIQGIDRMISLLSGIYSYTIISKKDLEKKSFKLRDAADMAIANLAEKIISSGAKIDNLIEESELVCWSFENMVLLFQNLINNAIKFRSKDAPAISICCKEHKNLRVCEIRDNGIGVDPEYKFKIFGLFEQLHPKEKYEGSGLGLAICDRIVSKYGGKIWVESEGIAGKGSIFIFTLPNDPEINNC